MSKRQNLTSRYWNEKVDYGGETVTRKERRRDLEAIARRARPGDEQAQRRMVEAYEMGADQREREQRDRDRYRELAKE